MGKIKSEELCVCCSGKPFGRCCEPFLQRHEKPKTPNQLMRSRFSAYALGDYKEYLIQTWHPHTARSISLADLDTPGMVWKALEVLNAEQKGDLGAVEFKATYSEDDGPDQVHHEKSAFHRLNGEWLYLNGQEMAETD